MPHRWTMGPELMFVGHHRWRAGAAVQGPIEYRIRNPCFTLCLHGDVDLTLDGHALPPARPVMWCLAPGTHVVERFGRTSFESWYVSFRSGGLAMRPSSGLEVEIDGGGRAVRVPRWKPVDASRAAALVEIYRSMSACSRQQGLAAAAQASALALELLGRFIELPASGEVGAGQRALERFTRLLQERAFAESRMADLAREAGGSPDHLRLLFQRRFGSRPVDYRNRLRLTRARELLAAGGVKVKEASREVGFSDPLYFSRLFRRRFGVAPSEVARGAGL